MTTEEFNQWWPLLAPSRRKFCDMLGVSKRTGDAYASGASPIPNVVALAIAALDAGLKPAAAPKKNPTA